MLDVVLFVVSLTVKKKNMGKKFKISLKFFKFFKAIFLELEMVDLLFSSLYNLVKSSEQGNKTWRLASKVHSGLIIGYYGLHWTNQFIRTLNGKNATLLQNAIKQENLDSKKQAKSKLLASLNLLRKLKIFFCVLVLVLNTENPGMTVSLLLLLEIGFVSVLMLTIFLKKKIFKGIFGALASLAPILFSVSLLIGLHTIWKDNQLSVRYEFRKSSENGKSSTQKLLTILLVILFGFFFVSFVWILVEFFKGKNEEISESDSPTKKKVFHELSDREQDNKEQSVMNSPVARRKMNLGSKRGSKNFSLSLTGKKVGISELRRAKMKKVKEGLD